MYTLVLKNGIELKITEAEMEYISRQLPLGISTTNLIPAFDKNNKCTLLIDASQILYCR